MFMGIHECVILFDFQFSEDILKVLLELYRFSQQLTRSLQIS